MQESSASINSKSAVEHELILYTIPFSHYCEIARWSLDWSNKPFLECAYLPAFHLLARASSLRTSSNLESSSSLPLITEIRESGYFFRNEVVVANDSWVALREMSNMPEPDKLTNDVKVLLDQVIGPCVRTFVYNHLFRDDAGDELFVRMCSASSLAPGWQKFMLSQKWFRSNVKKVMYKSMVKSDDYVKECKLKLETALMKLNQDYGQDLFENTKQLTMLKVAVCALLAPMAFPANYFATFCGSEGKESFTLKSLPADMRKDVEEFRCTKLGKMVLETYELHRLNNNKAQ